MYSDFNLTYLLKLTNSKKGIFQHAKFSKPNPKFGYATDDNARALILILHLTKNKKDYARFSKLLWLYFNFLKNAYNPKSKIFHNFLSASGKWLDKKGSDDCQARVLWALGCAVHYGFNKKEAKKLFNQLVFQIKEFTSPRSWAIGILGIYHYLSVLKNNKNNYKSILLDEIKILADKLFLLYQKCNNQNWHWYENYLTYENARLAQGMLIAGHVLKKKKLIKIGLESLEWLLRIQTNKKDCLSLVGNEKWFLKGKKKSQFDQQPVEVPALMDACFWAFRITQDQKWIKEIKKCFEWFLGKNDLAVYLVNFKTGACFDGLEKDRVNQNQGAESCLAWLWSLFVCKKLGIEKTY